MNVSAQDALRRLIEGNERFARGETRFLSRLTDVRTALIPGQRPFATIVGCSDSRVPPELVFDAGLGHLFIACWSD